MRSIQRLGLVTGILAACAFGYACSGSDAGDLLAPNDSPADDGSPTDDVTTDEPDGDAPGDDASQPDDAGDTPTKDAGHDAGDEDDASVDAGSDAGDVVDMTFFVTSKSAGSGGNIGGLEGADKLCEGLVVDATAKHTWRAYLSTTGNKGVDAKDRIGAGPWTNAKGKVIASSVAELHSDGFELTVDDALDEKGQTVPSQNRTIFTGTKADGTAADDNCGNWAKGGLTEAQGASGVIGSGADSKSSWNAGVKTTCATQVLPSGKPGRIYCFAAD